MRKDDVYSWRLSRSLKRRLERAAVARDRSVAELLREIVEEWLERAPRPDQEAATEAARRRALAVAGSIAGGDPGRAERAEEDLRARLARTVRPRDGAGEGSAQDR